jgi:hypothetical protein
MWSVLPKPVVTLHQKSQACFVQRYPVWSHMLPGWFTDSLLMFDFKDSPLPLSAPEPHDHDD